LTARHQLGGGGGTSPSASPLFHQHTKFFGFYSDCRKCDYMFPRRVISVRILMAAASYWRSMGEICYQLSGKNTGQRVKFTRALVIIPFSFFLSLNILCECETHQKIRFLHPERVRLISHFGFSLASDVCAYIH